MQLTIKRHAFGNDSTGGILYIDDRFQCYTVEDQEREFMIPLRPKVPGETAIEALLEARENGVEVAEEAGK